MFPTANKRNGLSGTCVLLSLLLLGGCATNANLVQIDDVLVGKKGSIVVIGAEGKNLSSLGLMHRNISPRIALLSIKDDGTRILSEFSTWTGYKDTVEYTADVNDGYAILSLPESKSDESYVVTGYQGNALGLRLTTVCKDRQTPVFKVKNGDVVYLGNYSVEITHNDLRSFGWRTNYTNDFPGAVNHIGKTHPSVAKQLKSVKPESRLSTIGGECVLSVVP